jgi:hypothetical protein
MKRLLFLVPAAALAVAASQAAVGARSQAASAAASPSAAPVAGPGVKQFYIAPEQVEALKALGLNVSPLAADSLAGREMLLVPGVAPRAGVASPTRTPWVNANGWRYRKAAGATGAAGAAAASGAPVKVAYDVPPGRAALAAAEAYAYGGDAVVKIDVTQKSTPNDLPALGAMMTFLSKLPAANLPDVADIGVVDDGSPLTAEVINLLSRRNLMFRVVKAPSSDLKVNIKLGTKEFPEAEAANPSAFALKVRRQLTDDERSLRLYGSEVVIARFTADGSKARLHLLNYGGRPSDGLRIRLRGMWKESANNISGADSPVTLESFTAADGWTEFTLPRLNTYAAIDLVK